MARVAEYYLPYRDAPAAARSRRRSPTRSGLSGFGHPELILFATSQATAATVLNDLGELVRGWRVLLAGERVPLRSGDVHLLTFPESADWLYAANDLYRVPGAPPVPALLVVPADELVVTPGDDQPCAFCG